MGKRDVLMERMTIDPDKVSGIIVDFLLERVRGQKKKGIVLGLSGGIDSAVAAALAVKAVGAARVHALHLLDRDSSKRSLKYARMVAEQFGVNLEVRDITPMLESQGIYRPLMMRATALLPGLSQLTVYASRLVCRAFGVNPFALVLTHGVTIRGRLNRAAYNALATTFESGFNARHILRRNILESYAAEKNLLLVGAANRSEALVGWFVKDGVDDMPLEPLLGLYKNQVRQLARYLEIPAEIINATPSPDMMKGISDELVIGFSYDKLDKALYALENGFSQDAASSAGISPADFEKVKALNKLSAWKRENQHEYPQSG